jgi:hypothetical protein
MRRERIIRAKYRVLCERESHILFAEIMLAGRSKAADMYEIVTGLRKMNKEEDRLPQNLVFHQVVVGQGGMDGRKDASTAGVPLKTIILATTAKEAARYHTKGLYHSHGIYPWCSVPKALLYNPSFTRCRCLSSWNNYLL